MKRSLDARTVVTAELPNALRDICEVGTRHFGITERDLIALVPRLRAATEVHDDFQEGIAIAKFSQRRLDVRGENRKQIFEIIGHFMLVLPTLIRRLGCAFDRFRCVKGNVDIFQSSTFLPAEWLGAPGTARARAGHRVGQRGGNAVADFTTDPRHNSAMATG